MKTTRLDLLFALLLILAVGLLFIGAPHGGAFFWSDSPRHALNGVFVADMIRAMPIHDPSGYAYAYYAKYPALTILFYPPLFYFFSAPFYWLFGVSHETALAAVFVLYVAFALGSYRLFRFWLSPLFAACAAASLALSPEIAFWGRQVMLEVPAFAPLVWSAVFFTSFRKTLKSAHLYWAALLLVLAMYTKISAVFMAPAYLVVLLVENRQLFRQRHVWIVGALSAIALIPLVVLTLKFGQANLQSASGVADSEVSRSSLAGWLWYIRQIPGQLGWPLALSAGAALVVAVLARARLGMTRGDIVFWAAWLFVGYLFFSAIDLKEARHSVFILPPLVFAAFAMFAAYGRRIGMAAAALLTLAVVIQTAVWRPVYFVDGYAEAVRYIAKVAPAGSSVVFSGYRDGSFVFNMRAEKSRPDLSVVRADKLLLRVAVRRELGVEQKPMDEQEIVDTLNRLGARYVVMQPGFWNDLAVMQRFEHVLASAQFERVATIPTPANHDAHEKELVIYRNLGNVAKTSGRIDIELPMINRSIPAAPSGK
ncbi:MAG: 4-amino-4-deoxy-L-arabinose transferase [Rhodocyclales bacterium]|nr:4-amino-4-deoxy-L-arabinose transferase [Rhodocyclales bacterium]